MPLVSIMQVISHRRTVRSVCADGRVRFNLKSWHPRQDSNLRPLTGRRLCQSGRGDQAGLEAHDERATIVIDGGPDRFEQTLSHSRVKGDMVAA